MKTYCLPGDSIPIPMDNLQVAVEQTYGVKIEICRVPLNSELLRGMIEIYEDRSVIYIDDASNLEWSRYVFTKEACHHLLKDPEFCTADPVGIIESVLLDISVEDGKSMPGKDVLSEELVKFAVIELLFPIDFRDNCKAEINEKKTSIYDIAARFQIPMHLVEVALSDPYMDIAKRIWDEINDPEYLPDSSNNPSKPKQ